MKYLIILISTFLLSTVANAKSMSMIDLLNVASLSDGQLSPDGQEFLFVKSEADWNTNKNVRSIWRTDINGENVVQISTNTADSLSPRWSPNGNKILFLTKRGNDDTPQIYIMPSNGGEAQRLSHHATAITSAEWAKDGTSIYFIASEPKDKSQLEREEKGNDIYKFEQNYQQKHLWKTSIDGTPAKRVTYGDYSVTRYKLSQDGKKIIYHRAPSPLLDAALENEIWIMDEDGSDAKQITKNTNPEEGAELSPNNKSILFLSWTNENDEPYFETNLFLTDNKGKRPQQLLGEFDHDIEQAHWSKDSSTIYFNANLGVHNELFKYDLSSKEITQLTNGAHTVSSWQYSPNNDQHLMSLKTANNNGDFWQMAANDEMPQKITTIFDYLTKDYELPKQDIIKWKGQDGTEIEGTIFYPNNYNKGQKYPLVVQTHGGPRSSDQWGGLFSTTSYAPVLASHGYIVLRPNYRGSLGYGDDFVRDMVGSYFNQSHLDVMTGVDHLIKEGIVDGEKLVKMGYSAGGHMTNKIITFTDRFKAASSAAGTVNWVSMYSQSDTRIYRTPWFGGTPWQEDAPIDTYWDHSPLKDIANVTTPTMIIVGGADVRVPKQQSVELYRALKSNDVETDLYIVPREQHIWKELHHKLSKMNIEMSWFEKHLFNRKFKQEKIDTDESNPPMMIVK